MVLREHLRSEEGRKQLRYAAVSLVFVPLGQVFVQFFHWTTTWPNYQSILVTACLLTIPNYFANKLYVWKDTSKDRLRTQITVFWVAALMGTGFAMGLAQLADHLTEGSSKPVQGLWLFIAQLAGYGIVWVGRYVFLDRVIFKMTHHGEEPDAEELDELHREFPV
jgi:putative flippase GtrA